MLVLVFAFLVANAVNARFVREVADGDADEQGTHQCEYNGKFYDEGEELPTRHLCLLCQCTKDFIEPNSHTCTVMDCPQTNKAEEGCEPQFNESDCCPVDWNCDNIQIAPPKCDPRYFKHYETKGCSPVYEDGNACPARFHCSPVDEENEDPNVCMYKGHKYQFGDSIETSNPCERCSCLKQFDKVALTCIPVECPSVFGVRPAEGCHEVYESGKCCSVRTECPSKDSEEPEKTCAYNGKTYYIGQKIYSEEDPCLICSCTENWTGTHDSSCKLFECNIERHLKELKDGCIPIYHEKTCCPIEFYCGSAQEGFRNETAPLANNADIESGNACIFKEQSYAVGQMLEINHPTNCVTCTCTTPPDFTCIHKSCPGPPNDDYENCKSTYTPGQCCATYNCLQHSVPVRVPQCSPVKCPAGCSEVTVHNSCPFCMCDTKLCSPPSCEDGCEVEKEVAAGQCPQCVCPDDVSSVRPICGPVKCSPQCYEAISPQGCPMCICGPLCSPPKCEDGCRIQRDVGEGECPGCVCSNSGDLAGPDQNIQCSPVKCPPSCHEATGDYGCPACVCDPMCSPPKCDPGCEIDPNPTGPCPGCVCDNEKPPTEIHCAPVKCGPLCHEAYGENGCPSCLCDPMCSPPQCGAGCHLDYDPLAGPCPGCVCDIQPFSDIQCAPVKCESYCYEVIGESGCPSCICPLCSKPKCDQPGCRMDTSTVPCPSCVCDSDSPKISEIQCAPVKCESYCYEVIGASGCPTCSCPRCGRPKCDRPGCRLDMNAVPCPKCVCDSDLQKPGVLCSPPKCDPSCEIDYSASPCPSCVCKYSPQILPGMIQCSPPRCEPGCQIDSTTYPCPSCACDNDQEKLGGIQCSMPKCDPGCEIDYNSSPCPSCACDHNEEKLPDIQCASVKCASQCPAVIGEDGCPTCVCRPLCSIPKCPIGCPVESAFPCPRCSCFHNPRRFAPTRRPTVRPTVQCAPVNCGPSCKEVMGGNGCPTCQCPLCTPPRCEPGCEVEHVPSSGPCPGCVCSNRIGQRLSCPPMRCELPCRMTRLSQYACPSCLCYSIPCPKFNCNPGFIEKVVPPERCSQCVPDNSGLSEIQCSPVKCDPGCHEETGDNGCPKCVCGGHLPQMIQCSPPKCDPGCRVEHNPDLGPCPGCVC